MLNAEIRTMFKALVLALGLTIRENSNKQENVYNLFSCFAPPQTVWVSLVEGMGTGEGRVFPGFLAADSRLIKDNMGQGAFSSDHMHSCWSLHAVLCP